MIILTIAIADLAGSWRAIVMTPLPYKCGLSFSPTLVGKCKGKVRGTITVAGRGWRDAKSGLGSTRFALIRKYFIPPNEIS